jgi:ATP-dependent Lhr-like helicase
MSTFSRFPPRLQEAIVSRLGWTSLRPVQELAGEAILGQERGGAGADRGRQDRGVDVPRIAELSSARPAASAPSTSRRSRRCSTTRRSGSARTPRWSGSPVRVARRRARPAKRRFVKEPAELLMTTPESLEVMLISPRCPCSAALQATCGTWSSTRCTRSRGPTAAPTSCRSSSGSRAIGAARRAARRAVGDRRQPGSRSSTWLKGSSKREGVVVDPPKEPRSARSPS